MADPLSQTKPHFPSPPKTNPIMRSTKFLLKSIFCALFLFSLPLFPSQAPAFITDAALTKFWELLHLLFIGIAVSYGLFSRRTAPRHVESAESSVSQVNNFLAIFDELYDEKPTVHGRRSSSVSEGESMFRVPTDETSEKSKPESFNCENSDTEKQTWNSQYLQCQPMIVVAKPSNSLADEHEKPLGLPIRSLRSRIVDPVRPKPRARSGCGSSSSSRSNSMDSLNQDCNKNVNFGDMGPVNLEQKFDESVPLPSPIPWRSRSGKMEMRENLSAIKQPPLHSRHLSVEESQIRKPSSFRSYSNASSSSNQSTVTSNGVSELLESRLEKLGKEKCNQSASSSVDSFFVLNSDFNENPKSSGGEEFSQSGVSELLESRLEKLGKEKSSQSASASSFFELNAEKDLWAKKFSGGEEFNSPASSNQTAVNSFLQTRVSELRSEKVGKEKRDQSASVSSFFEFNADSDLQSKFCGGQESSSSSMKNGSNGHHRYSKSLSDSGRDTEKVDEFQGEVRKRGDQKRKASVLRGKSVRTFRQREEAKKTEQTHERSRRDRGTCRSGSDQSFLKENFDREETAAAAAAGDDSVSDAGSEVDRKAGEFIAKFREQIRLQKAGSIDGSVSLDFNRGLL